MKKIVTLIISTFISFQLIAQISHGGQPYSFHHTIKKKTPEIIFPAMNVDSLYKFDDELDLRKGKKRFAALRKLNLSAKNNGHWQLLPDGGRLWTLQLTSKGALGIILYYDTLFLPQKSRFFVYSADKKTVLGSFNHKNTPVSKRFVTGLIRSESVVLEYYEPANTEKTAIISLENMAHAYRKNVSGFGGAQDCQVNVNCSEGESWANVKSAILRVILVDQYGTYWGTATTINNTLQDNTPYVLTAEHNILDKNYNVVEQKYFDQFLFYFNYESSTCADPMSEDQITIQSLEGVNLLARSDDGGGDTGSDFALLEFQQNIPQYYNPFFAGWNRQNIAINNGVCIHHPYGDIKKISHSGPAESSSFLDITPNTHWRVQWKVTDNGSGGTEGGSSGSPLLNNNGQIVGLLTGGSVIDCADDRYYDFFGKFSYSWVSNGTKPERQLKPWLDPQNTGITNLNGKPLSTKISKKTDAQPAFSVYPNPANEIIYIGCDQQKDFEIEYQIFDIIGQVKMSATEKIYKGKTLELKINHLKPGAYLLKINYDNQKVVKKFLKLK